MSAAAESVKVDLTNPREVRLMALNLATAARQGRTGVDFRSDVDGKSDDLAAQILHDAKAFQKFITGGGIAPELQLTDDRTPPE